MFSSFREFSFDTRAVDKENQFSSDWEKKVMCTLCGPTDESKQSECEQIDERKQVNEKKNRRRRKKLWEIADCYHCSIIGACLSIADLKKFARKNKISLSTPQNQHSIHTHFVHQAGQHDDISKKMHKYLDNKFSRSIKYFAGAKTDEDLLDLWREARNNHAVAGPYWAVTTHPIASSDLQLEIFGEIHMLSHESVKENTNICRRLKEAEERADIFGEGLVELRTEGSIQLVQKNEQIRKLKQQLCESAGYLQQLVEARGRIHLLETGVEKENLYTTIKNLNRTCRVTEDKISSLERQNMHFREENSDLTMTVQDLQGDLADKQAECAALESLLQVSAPACEAKCAVCENNETCQCPGPDLCGRKVLYVGGQTGLLSQYKLLVENSGGNFIHHDGGKEDRRGKLPQMVSQADVVICPVNCVSHDACTKAKRFCKQQAKPFIPMRSASISSLAKSLMDVSTAIEIH
ncbi:MAG: DUF2325 domain-containing protein [Desulfobulbaceae bacterium]|nr:DUF2325 domain-containing protein [Desulfobulbaceae bacterium]